MQAREYVDSDGRAPFGKWFDGLDAPAAAKVTRAIAQMEGGNLSRTEPVGEGVHEDKIDWGPGYRIYFGNDGREIIILLGGGTKRQQDKDIAIAKARWSDYRARKRQEGKQRRGSKGGN